MTTVSVDTLLRELALYVATTVGSTVGGGGRVFISILPDQPNDAISVMPSNGPANALPSDPTRVINTQILIRNSKFKDGLVEAQKIFDALDAKANVLSSVQARAEALSATVGSYFLDQSNRFLFPLNFAWRLIYTRAG